MNTEQTNLKIKDLPEITSRIDEIKEKIEGIKNDLDSLLIYAIKEIEAKSTNPRNLADAMFAMSASASSMHQGLSNLSDGFNRALDYKL